MFAQDVKNRRNFFAKTDSKVSSYELKTKNANSENSPKTTSFIMSNRIIWQKILL